MNLKKHKYWIKGIALALVLALGCPALPMKAAEMTVSDVEGEEVSESLIQGTTDLDVSKPEEGTEQGAEKSDNASVETQEEVLGGAVSEDEEIKKEETTIEQRINYVYVESSYLETPGTQRVVVSWGDGAEGIEEMTLTVQDSNGTQEEWTLSNSVEDLYLFEKEYTDVSQNGTYEAIALTVKTEETEKTFTMAEMEAEVLFGVNEEYAGIEELKAITEDGSEEDAEVSASVATISEDGTLEAQESIAAALEEVEAEVQAETIPAKSRATKSRTTMPASNTKAGNIVVALDPGHDASDAGASGNGLREEVLTLKIANYCKEELEQYAGVTVYMTRTGAACPYGKSGISCMPDRVKAASDRGAKIFVSFHLNATGYGTAYGAEVIVPNNNWKPDVGSSGAALGNKILDELVKLGLARRKVYSKDTTLSYETYPDGSKSDYYSVQVNCKYYGIPGIIVEHAFIDNVGDANKYLKTEAGLKSLGVADATGIAKYLGVSKGRWETDNQGNTYYYEEGKRVYGEKYIGGEWYHFDETTGVMTKGWYDFPNKTVYYKPTGEMIHGEGYIDGKWYYFDEVNGSRYMGWKKLPGKTVYYNTKGEMVYGEQTIDGKVYYFHTVNGGLYNGWLERDGKKYYYVDGEKFRGEKYIDKEWYYFKDNGEMLTGWHDFPDKRVYYNSTGKMIHGEGYIDKKWYYFNKINGSMVTGWYDFPNKKVYYKTTGEMAYGKQNINGKIYYFDEVNGGMKRGEVRIGTKWYLFDNNTGEMITGWYNFPNKTVYYSAAGEMVYGEQTIDGKMYYFHTVNGGLYTGWLEHDKKKYYYVDGEKFQGEKYIDKKWYYFNDNGEMLTGWHNFPDKRVYYKPTGEMIHGEGYIDKKWYYFNEINGSMVTGWHNFSNKTVYYSSTGEMLYGAQEIDDWWYYFNTVNGAMLKNQWYNNYYYGPDGKRMDAEFHPIEGTTSVTVTQMVNFYKKNSPISYPSSALAKGGADTIEKFAQIFHEEAARENIKAEVVWAQTMLETGYLKFGGQVKIEQFNFAGLGAIDGGAKGADFSGYGANGVRMGVRAQIQHLKAYASKKPLTSACVDPRFNLVTRGCAQYVEWLGQKENPSGKGWATSPGYGYRIVILIQKILKS